MVFWTPWRQGQYFDNEGKCCLVGALQLTAYEGRMLGPASYEKDCAIRNARYFIQEALAPGSEFEVDLEAWNDLKGRTLEQVLGILYQARQLALAAGQ